MRGTGKSSFGHSISLLLKDLDFDTNLIDLAKKIDKYYIPTRYTDVWSEGTPEDYYTVEDANDAIMCAQIIIKEVEAKWKLLKRE